VLLERALAGLQRSQTGQPPRLYFLAFAGWGPQAVTVSADPMGDGSVLQAFSLLVGVPVGSRVLIQTPGKEGSYQADAIVLDVVALVRGDEEEAEDDAADASPSASPSESAGESPSAAATDGG
jgi:hypothetical protein